MLLQDHLRVAEHGLEGIFQIVRGDAQQLALELVGADELGVDQAQVADTLAHQPLQLLLPGVQPPEPVKVRAQGRADDGQRQQDAEEQCLVKEGLHRQRDAGAGAVPDAVVVAGDHLERVLARRQVGVADGALPGDGAPVLLEAYHLVLEAHFLRRQQTQGGETDGDPVRARRQFDGTVGFEEMVVGRHLFDDHVGHNRVHPAVGRIDHHRTLDRGQPQLAVPAADPGRLGRPVALQAVHSLGALEGGGRDPIELAVGESVERFLFSLEDPAVGDHPQGALLVLDDLERGVAEQAVRHRDLPEPAVAVPVQPAAVGADPEVAAGVLEDAPDRRVGESLGRAERLPHLAVLAEQPAVVSAHPHPPLAILMDRVNEIVGEPVAGVVISDHPSAANHVDAAAVGARPDVAAAVHADRPHNVVGQPRSCGERAPHTVPKLEDAAPVCAHPERAVSGFGERPDPVVGQAVGAVVHVEPVADEANHAAADGADPDPSGAVFEERAHHVHGQAALQVEDQVVVVLQAHEPVAVRAQPQAPLAVLPDGIDGIVEQPALQPHAFELAVAVPVQHAVAGADPHQTLMVHAQGAHFDFRQPGWQSEGLRPPG